MIQMHEEAIPFSITIQTDRSAPKTEEKTKYSQRFGRNENFVIHHIYISEIISHRCLCG